MSCKNISKISYLSGTEYLTPPFLLDFGTFLRSWTMPLHVFHLFEKKKKKNFSAFFLIIFIKCIYFLLLIIFMVLFSVIFYWACFHFLNLCNLLWLENKTKQKAARNIISFSTLPQFFPINLCNYIALDFHSKVLHIYF